MLLIATGQCLYGGGAFMVKLGQLNSLLDLRYPESIVLVLPGVDKDHPTPTVICM